MAEEQSQIEEEQPEIETEASRSKWGKIKRRVSVVASLKRAASGKLELFSPKASAQTRFSIPEDEEDDGHGPSPGARSRADTAVSEAVSEMMPLEDTSVGGGVLIDFLQRNLQKMPPSPHIARKRKDTTFSVTSTFSSVSRRLEEGLAEKLLDPHDYPGWAGYDDALRTINNEMLLCSVMEDVTEFRKWNDDPAWTVDTLTLLRKRAFEIKKYHTESKCLGQEVSMWLFRYTVSHTRPPDLESAQARHRRTQQVWSQLHTGGSKVEPSGIKAPFKDDLRMRLFGEDGAGTEADEMRPKSAGSLARCVSAGRLRPQSAGGVMRKDSSLLQDLDWKRRSCRSNASVGNWDWKHGSAMELSCTPPVTTSKVSCVDHWSAALFDATAEEIKQHAPDQKEEGSKFLSQSIMSIANPISKVHSAEAPMNSGRNSASLPTLRLKTSTALCKHVICSKQPVSSKRSLRREKPGLFQSQLPVTSSFTVPWQGRNPMPVLKCEDAPVKQYLRSCLQNRNIPRPMPFITGHSLKLKAGGQVLCDKDLLDITVALGELKLTEIDLEDNTSLTPLALLKFVHVLANSPVAGCLERLSLKRCVHASQHAVLTSIISLIGSPSGVCNLQHLDLTDVVMGIRCHLPFSKAVCDHPKLKSLTLCNNDLGIAQGSEAKEFIRNLLGSKSIEALDLGWNCLTADFFFNLGQRHIEMQKLRRLSLSNCTTSPARTIEATSLVHFLQHLAHDRTLHFLDVSLNHIDFRAALVLEDALMHCKALSEVNISYNPLGIYGMRSLLRLLCSNCSGLMHFACADCFSGKLRDARDGLQMFRASNPGGRYTFELCRPYHRALLRMLYKTCDRLGLSTSESFSNIVSSCPHWDHAHKDDHGVFVVPTEGQFVATFSIDKAIKAQMQGLNVYDFEGYLERRYELMRYSPSFKKVVPLFAQWQSLKGDFKAQLVMLDALSKDFFFSYPHIRQMTMSDINTCEIVERLLGCVKGGVGARYLTLGLNTRITGYLHSLKEVSSLLMFNVHNPNGHYRFTLSNHMDHAIAERLLLLDRWESNVAQSQGRMDISQRGNYSVIRNERFQEIPIDARAMVEWHMPEYDVLEFDYSSNCRPTAKAMALDDVTHSNIMLTLQQSECLIKNQIGAMRLASHTIYFKSKQLRSLFGVYKEEEDYAELVVIFFLRIVDIQNEKIFRVRIENDALLFELGRRVGKLTMFPFIQTEQSHYFLNMADREDRVLISLLVTQSKYEDSFNLRDPEYHLENGVKDALANGIPRSWEKVDAIPQAGTLKLYYGCAPENRNFERRKELINTYLQWPVNVGDKDVMWWSSLSDVPPDVLLYLEFLIARGFENMEKAFVEIDGEDGNGQISLREFEDAYARMGCKKFQAPRKSATTAETESQRICNVFRWLDPGGEGQVSLDEFMILDQMFKEVLLSIEEFVEFCVRTFGDNLEDAFNNLDADGGGGIDSTEWAEACACIGYCGPCQSIFKFCDKDEEGSIELDEFLGLEKFKKIKKKIAFRDSVWGKTPKDLFESFK